MKAREAWRRFRAWFLGQRAPIEVREVVEQGFLVSVGSGERYRLHIYPRRDRVVLAIDPGPNLWLRRAALQDGWDALSVEVKPDEAAAARLDLVADADRRVAAVKAAWELGWRPQVQ